jgi:hypothetical protein
VTVGVGHEHRPGEARMASQVSAAERALVSARRGFKPLFSFGLLGLG